MQEYVIVYTYKRKQYTARTKPCTYAQAQQIFAQELNSLKSYKLVHIYAD
jgi:hypothetical protein